MSRIRRIDWRNCPAPSPEAPSALAPAPGVRSPPHAARLPLLERGWPTTSIAYPYDVERAEATGYLALRRGGDEGMSDAVLRVVRGAPEIAEVNRRFRMTLIYQVSALSFVLLAVILFFHSLVAPHRRLAAEARSGATGVSAGGTGENHDAGQFLLDPFHGG